MIEQLKDILTKHGIDAPIEWNTEKPTRAGSHWFIGKKWDFQGKEFFEAWFGDYKKNLKEHWTSTEESKYTKEELKAAKEQREKLLKEERDARDKFQIEAAIALANDFETFQKHGETPYLTRKSISGHGLFGARLMPNPGHDPILAVPLRDVDGRFWNFQRIYSQKLSAGDKFFAEGARIDGCFFHLQPAHGEGSLEGRTLEKASQVFICEGFATAVTIQLALGSSAQVVAAFNAANLILVATEIRAKFPDIKITVCADNDAYTLMNNKPYNVGLEKGRRAAGATKGEIRWPIFKYPQKNLTDFNDLHAAEGLEKVKDQIENPSKYVQGIQPMCLDVSRSGKLKEPTEKEVCDYLLVQLGDKLVAQDKSLFLYSGTHWVELDTAGINKLKQQIQIAANGLLGSRDIENYFRYLFIHAPTVPRGFDLFKPNPFVANFQNGTLHFVQVPGSTYSMEFRKHSRHDYLTAVLPFDKPDWEPGEALPPAPQFDAMIDRLWADNKDKEQMRDLAYELIGACLMPAFPTIAIYYGRPNSGKSTFIKLLVRLMNPENTCSVQLCDMQGFNMESMVGKLVNFDTDIDVNKPMNDSEVKKIIDRVPRRVRRKGRSDVYAHLPAVHLFAANSLPKSLDGSSHAYGRRLILVKTESFQAPAKVGFDFEARLLEAELPAIVARGLAGLHRLMVNNGHYTIPETSHDTVRTLEMDSDIVGQFLSDIEHREVYSDKGHVLTLGDEARIERPKLWESFKNWQDHTQAKNVGLGKVNFMQRLESRGFKVVTVHGVRCFKGIGVQVQNDPIA